MYKMTEKEEWSKGRQLKWERKQILRDRNTDIIYNNIIRNNNKNYDF